jgi:hypothetical protein
MLDAILKLKEMHESGRGKLVAVQEKLDKFDTRLDKFDAGFLSLQQMVQRNLDHMKRSLDRQDKEIETNAKMLKNEVAATKADSEKFLINLFNKFMTNTLVECYRP